MKYFLVFILTILMASCQHVERPEKPDNLIPKDIMVNILTDAYLNNAARSFNNRQLLAVGAKLDSFVYAKHSIDSLTFVKSNEYYASNLNDYIDIFNQVEERITALKVKADTLKSETLKRKAQKTDKDSVLKATKDKDSIAK